MRDSAERDLAVADALGKMADARIKGLEQENAALREQLAHRTTELEREGRETQKWNNRANQLAIEAQGLRDRLVQVEKERDEAEQVLKGFNVVRRQL